MDAKEKSERLIEAACCVLSAAPNRRLNAVVLNKVLFYLDLSFLRDKGETLTGNSYIALQQGPVVANYPQRLIGQLESRGIAEQIDEWNGSKPVSLKAPLPNFTFMDESARAQASLVTAYFADQTSRQVSDYSHENPGWQLAWAKSRLLGKPCSIDLYIAMQQIIQDDSWMDMPLAEGEEDLLVAADAEDGEDW